MACAYAGGEKSLIDFVEAKLARYEKEEKNMQTLFRYMFSESDYPMAEKTDGYRISTVTYGQCRDGIFAIIPSLKTAIGEVKSGSLIGLYMQNSLEWIQIFWAILALGYKPLLLNTRMSDETINNILTSYNVEVVVSDGKTFCIKTIKAQDVFAMEKGESAKMEDLTFENEVIFTSSGTSENIKLCVYRGKNFYYQIKDSAYIVKTCPKITQSIDGQIKQLALLPFYHIFGFTAVYMWFGFFSRTFVFLKDMSAKTVAATVKKHKVTHIFAVPMVWEGVYKAVLKGAKAQGEKQWKKFQKGLKAASSDFGRKLLRSSFAQVREKIFGESVKFMISGGSAISSEALNFFNAIGYHLCNGYGMTEVGVTSVELTAKIKTLSTTTVGKPLPTIEYKIDENGLLMVRGKSISRKIITQSGETVNDYEAWFNTGDLAMEKDGRYYVLGRSDDLVICNNGENLNPNLYEKAFISNGIEQACIIQSKDGVTLVAYAPKCFSESKAKEIKEHCQSVIVSNSLAGQINKVVITTNPLMESNEFKVSRKKVVRKYENGEFFEVDKQNFEQVTNELEAKVQNMFACALKKEVKEIGLDANFFTDLGGTSLDYFELLDIVKTEFGATLPTDGGISVVTVRQVCAFVRENS